MREKQKQALQAELGEKVLARIIKIQRWVRAKLHKCRFLHLKRCTITLQVTAGVEGKETEKGEGERREGKG
jgi:hypothetical protein